MSIITIESLLGEQKTKELLANMRAGKTIIVKGTQGPSGKTTITKAINDMGFKAVEAFNVYEITLDYKEES